MVQVCDPDGAARRIPDVLRALVASLLLLALDPAVAAARPEAGPWAGPPASAPGIRATVRFTVDGATGFVQPVVRYRLRRCGRGHVFLGLAAVQGGRFEVMARHAHVRLRLTGRFDSSVHGHGDLRIRARHCRTRRVPWTAEPAASSVASEDDRIADEDLEDGEELELDDVDEAGEPIEDDDLPLDDEQP